MRIAKAAVEADFRRSAPRVVVRGKHVPWRHVTTAVQLKNALAREDALLREKSDLLQRHEMVAQEFEHRLFNSLQLIVSLLWLQSRAAATPEAAAQLNIAADRVSALGRVHRRLHGLDHQERVEFKQYIQCLREDLSGAAIPGGSEARNRSGGCECRDSNGAGHSAGLYCQRADHQFGEIRQRRHHRSIGNSTA
jgi:two-component sensor histidine kinase